MSQNIDLLKCTLCVCFPVYLPWDSQPLPTSWVINDFQLQFACPTTPSHKNGLVCPGRTNQNVHAGASLAVQGLRLHIPNARGLCSISDQGTRSHMQQPSLYMLQLKMPQWRLKISHATTKTQCSQINKYKLKQTNKNPKCSTLWPQRLVQEWAPNNVNQPSLGLTNEYF